MHSGIRQCIITIILFFFVRAQCSTMEVVFNVLACSRFFFHVYHTKCAILKHYDVNYRASTISWSFFVRIASVVFVKLKMHHQNDWIIMKMPLLICLKNACISIASFYSTFYKPLELSNVNPKKNGMILHTPRAFNKAILWRRKKKKYRFQI